MFEYEFPVFILVRNFTRNMGPPPSITFHDILALIDPNQPTGMAVFTDRPGAEQFRDEQAKEHRVLEVPTPTDFVMALQAGRQTGAAVVARDPFRFGLGIQVEPIEDVIRRYTPPASPAPHIDG